MTNLIALLAGMIFGIGLLVSGMMNPEKVIGFLDFFGDWDPSLAFVMASALIVTIPTFHLLMKLEKPVLMSTFTLPKSKHLDKPLITGAAIFGAGWGLLGYCPGPAIASLSNGTSASVLFVLSMIVGMFAADRIAAHRS